MGKEISLGGWIWYVSQDRQRNCNTDNSKQLKQTQKHIRRVLTERWYAWEDARKIAASDPSIDLTGESAGGAYNEELDTTSPLFDNDSRPYSESLDSSRI